MYRKSIHQHCTLKLIATDEVLSKRLELAEEMLELVLEESIDLSWLAQRQLLSMAKALADFRRQGRW